MGTRVGHWLADINTRKISGFQVPIAEIPEKH